MPEKRHSRLEFQCNTLKKRQKLIDKLMVVFTVLLYMYALILAGWLLLPLIMSNIILLVLAFKVRRDYVLARKQLDEHRLHEALYARVETKR